MIRSARYHQPGFFLLALILLWALPACNLTPAGVSTALTPSFSSSVTPLSSVTPPATLGPAAVVKTAPAVNAIFPSTFLRMVDTQSGWGVGKGRVLRSMNGGQAWDDITPKDLPSANHVYPQVYGIDAQSAWILAPDLKDFNHGTLYRTQDGGQSWQTVAVPFRAGFIQLIDAKTGWVLAERGAAAGSMAVDLFHTSDGGTTWTMDYHIDPQNPGNASLPFSGGKTGMAFRDRLNGWIAGTVPMEGVTYLYATEDGGKTWKAVQLDLPAGLAKSQTTLDAPQFFDEKTVILPVHLYNSGPVLVIYVSRDGGATWKATQPVQSYGPLAVPAPNDFIVWDGGNLHVSRDAGQSWKDLTPNINLNQKIGSLQFINPMTGWALSYDGKTSQLYRTNDGGQTWERLSQ